MRFTAVDAARAAGGTLIGPDTELVGASFDSRSVGPGQLFVPVIADRDGHGFVADALARGAGAYLSSRGVTDGGTAIVVDDTVRALGAVAAWARGVLDGRLAGRTVGITGSVGKTTTKELVAAALTTELRTAASPRSFNNDQGLPVTILNAPDDVEALVLEMGMRGFGEIDRLCRVARPSVGVVTAVAEAHTERVGGIEGVARAKAELVVALPADGTAVLNGDDPRVAAMRALAACAVVTYGTGTDADVRMVSRTVDDMGCASMEVATPWGMASLRMGLPGLHMAHNALAALAVAGVLGVSLERASAAIGSVEGPPMRMQVRRTPSGATVIDDCYNANPASMQAALETLAALSARRRVLVVGEMAELEHPEVAHHAVASLAHRLGIELVAVGTDRYGPSPVSIDHAIEVLASLKSGDAALVKGSRVARLERVVEGSTGRPDGV
jgi:UDP-N-acetylmuramoyl-tripeptide--D-alanyl-D-alanine ligase